MTDKVPENTDTTDLAALDSDPQFQAWKKATGNVDPDMFYTDVKSVGDDIVYASMMRRKVDPDYLADPDDRAAYIAYVAKFGGK